MRRVLAVAAIFYVLGFYGGFVVATSRSGPEAPSTAPVRSEAPLGGASPSLTAAPANSPTSQPVSAPRSTAVSGTASWGLFGGRVVTRLARGTRIGVCGRLGCWRGHSWGYGPAKFGVGLELEGRLIGVVMVGRPVGRHAYPDGLTVEVTRVCTLGDRNASSRLYGAACRAAAALGYRRAITYNLASESGASLRAAGFRPDAKTPVRAWRHTSGPRVVDRMRLFDAPKVPDEPKLRWVRDL